MSVLLPNATLGVRRRSDATERNSHGQRVPAGWGPVVGFRDGRTSENAQGTWNLGVDPDLWPVRKDDLVIDTAGSSWLVVTADLIRNNYDSTVDWVRITANRRSGGGTEPGGSWFVARYEDVVGPETPGAGEPVLVMPKFWQGVGAPPDGFGDPDDQYLDLATGVVYQLGA